MAIKAPIFLVGATGVGKSEVGMELARRCGGAILAMDAMQVYRGADIGTGKPSAAERAEIPHGGLDLVDFGAAFDVAQYLKHAGDFLREQQAAGRRVIIVGGTGLYFRALTRGLCEAPQGEEELRAELRGLSTEELRERLRRVDPGMLERVDGANPRRLARAIEVFESSGRSLREWQEETPEALVPEFAAIWVQREKEELQERIARRIEAMFAEGWVEEVRGLVERCGLEAVWSFAGIGYREIAEALGEADQITKLTKLTELGGEEGKQILKMGSEGDRFLDKLGMTEGEKAGEVPSPGTHVWRRRLPTEGVGGHRPPLQAEAAAIQRQEAALKSDILVATRQYAKRQLTWFAREPNLRPVMFSGTQLLPADVLALL